MAEIKFFAAGQDLQNPNADCKSLKSGQLLMLNHPAGQVVGDHAHEETHIVFVRQGRIAFQIGGQTFSLSPGDTLVIPPKTPHSFTVPQDAACRTSCVSV